MCDGHNANRFCHLERFLNRFKLFVRGFCEPDRIVTHVDLEIDFALCQIAEGKMPVIKRERRPSFSQNIKRSRVLALRVMVIAEVVVARCR